MRQGKARFLPRRAAFPVGYYGANSIYQGYISLYYTHLAFSNAQLGALSAITALAALIFQPLWGMLGDLARQRRKLLALLALSSACALPLATMADGFAFQLGAAFVFYALFCALLPLGDAILLESDDGCFGAYRLAGGASFALCGAVFGLFARKVGAGGALWWAAALLLLTSGAALLLPDTPRRTEKRVNPLSLLKDKRLRTMLELILPLQMTMGYFYTFYPPWFKELGGGETLLGVGYFISAASEAPYLLMSARIYRRFGAEKPMGVGALLLALRFLLLGLARGPLLALLSQILHGGGFIVLSVSMAYWIEEHVPPNLRASGQALLNMVSFGAARVCGNLLGGVLTRALGRGGVFLAASVLCGGIFGILLLTRMKRRSPM